MTQRIAATLLLLLLALTAFGFQTPAPWTKFTSPLGRFSVLMPGEPKEEKETKQTGGPLAPFTNYLYSAKTENAFYLVGWVDYRPGARLNVQGELAANRDNFVKSVHATLGAEKPIKLGLHPGIEFTAESPQATFLVRTYVVGQRPYMLVAATFKGKDDGANIDKFFSSFALKPGR